MSYIFWKLLFQCLILAFHKPFLSILRFVRFLLTKWDAYVNSILHCVVYNGWQKRPFLVSFYYLNIPQIIQDEFGGLYLQINILIHRICFDSCFQNITKVLRLQLFLHFKLLELVKLLKRKQSSSLYLIGKKMSKSNSK